MKVVSLWLIFLFQKEAALFSDMKKKKKGKNLRILTLLDVFAY